MDTFKQSKELYINMNPRDIPKWDARKQLWEQNPSTIQFYLNEYDKIKNGINLGGYYMSGWMYFHINYYQTNRLKDGSRSMGNVVFDDNIYFLMECYKEAVREQKGLCMWGTRGFAKTTLLGSHKHWTTICKSGTSMLVYKGSENLAQIRTMIMDSVDNIHPAFKMDLLRGKGAWDKDPVVFGNTLENGTDLIHSQIKPINAEAGKGKASEKGAGFTPTGFMMDEIGTYDPRGIFKAAKVAFKLENKSLFTFILCGTGGNEELTEGAKELILNPKDNDILVMNWDLLNNMVPEEHITWKEDIGRKFCTFVPGQMSYRENVPKVETSFKDFSKGVFKNDELNNLKIKVTDWGASKEAFKKRIDESTDEKKKTEIRMYYPLCVDDSFLTNNKNPFNTEAITKRLRELKEKPRYTLVDIEVNHKDNKIETTFQTDKPIAERGYKKNISAPFMIFDGFPKEIPPKYKFVSGADDYKSADATTESLGSIYVLQRRTLNMPLERIVACLVERPPTHREMHAKWEKLIRATQAICNLEAADMSFVSYLEDIIKVDAYQYLHPFINPHGDLSTKKKSATASNYKFGTYPHQWNVKILFETVIQYTQQTFTTGFNPETGLPVVNTGIDLIDDPMLLQEMLDFKYGSGNYDRIFSFGWALLLARHMDSKNIMPEDQHVEKYNRDMFAQSRTKHANFAKSKARNF